MMKLAALVFLALADVAAAEQPYSWACHEDRTNCIDIYGKHVDAMGYPVRIYTLITVTYGGDVGHSRGYETLHMCEEAKSLALTGKTIEAKEAADKAAKEAKDKREAEWRAAHPPRPPKTDEEKSWPRDMSLCSGDGCFRVGDDGMIYETGPWWPSLGSGIAIPPDPGSIKVAECVIEP